MGQTQGCLKKTVIVEQLLEQDKKNPEILVSDIESETNDTSFQIESEMEEIKPNKSKNSIFNDVYEILSELGTGKSSKVYLAREIKNPRNLVALKLIRQEYLKKGQEAVQLIENEITLLNGLNHHNLNKLLAYGDDGKIVKTSGRVISNLVYMILEYIPYSFYDVCEKSEAMGEDGSRFFMREIVTGMKYLHTKKKAVHRDLKLENILVDEQLNVKIADFGLGAFNNISSLNEYHGTKTYMAPEIKEYKTYDGRQVDIFSLGVIMFIIAQGIFPFQEALPKDFHYKMIINGDKKMYWKATGGQSLSQDFKDLFLKMVHPDPTKRPTIQELSKNDWLNAPFNSEKVRNKIIAQQDWKQETLKPLPLSKRNSTKKSKKNHQSNESIKTQSTNVSMTSQQC